MHLRRRASLLGLTLGVVLLVLVSSAAYPAHAQPAAPATTITPPQNGVIVVVQATPTYDVSAANEVQINAEARASGLLINLNTTLTITTNFKPTITATAIVNGGIVTLAVTVVPATDTATLVLPPKTSSFQISIVGSEGGASFLWRYLTGVPFVAVTGLSGYNGFPTIYFVLPSGTVVSQVYDYVGGTLPLTDVQQNGTAPGQLTYVVTNGAGLLVFQSHLYLPISIAITIAALAVVSLAALNLFAFGRRFFGGTVGRVSSGFSNLRGRIRLPGTGRRFKLRRLFQPRRLLVLFILCGFVMIALGVLGGPDPQTKAYVISSNSNIPLIQGQLQQVAGNVEILTPTQDFSDFAVMSSVGDFNVVVISNYPTSGISDISSYVVPNLVNVPVVVLDNTTNPTLAREVEASYPNSQTVFVQNATNLNGTEASQLSLLLSLSARTNLLGLHVSQGDFKLFVYIEALLSMLIVLIGWAYLGSLTSESRATSDLNHLVMVIAAGVFVFFFSETLYVTTSSLLALPLSLHAVNSDAHELTAIGTLGFGGGSTPRFAAGLVGILLGAIGSEEGVKFKKSEFALVGGVALILLANPLYLGTLVYQGILLFFPVGSYAFGAAFSSSLSLKGFIYGIGDALGGGVTPQYVLSAGKILYFAGLVPLAYMKKMGRTTTVIALLFVAMVIGDGGVRVGEMTPDKTYIAVLPGIVTGFAFVVLLLAFASIENYVRGNWKSRA